MLRMLNQKGASRMDTVVKLALVFIISLLSFSIGTFVGKQFSDQQHKTAMIEKEGQERSTASIPTNSLDVAPENALTDADIASITEEFAHAEKDDIDELLAESNTNKVDAEVVEEDAETTAKTETTESSIEDMVAEVEKEAKPVEEKKTEVVKKEMPNALPEKTAKAQVKADTTAKTAEKIAKNETPEVKDRKVASRIPNSLPSTVAASTVGKYTVQVAAYQKEDEAKKHADKLTNQGYSAFYLDANVKGNTWYRVNVGLIASKPKANVFRKQLMKEANLKSALVKRIVK
jgi:cell division septation protein DedD